MTIVKQTDTDSYPVIDNFLRKEMKNHRISPFNPWLFLFPSREKLFIVRYGKWKFKLTDKFYNSKSKEIQR